jgi:TRAP-type C4-dicarboxylate transport system permease small subunit
MRDQPPKKALDETVLNAINKLIVVAASIALLIIVVTFGWHVFGRYVLNDTPTWVEQLAKVLICFIAFLGAAAGVRDETHLGVSFFRDMLPDVIQKLIIILIDFALAAFGLVMLIAGWELMAFGWDSMIPMLNIPESFKTLAITMLGALMCLFCAARGLRRIVTFSDWTPNPVAKET